MSDLQHKFAFWGAIIVALIAIAREAVLWLLGRPDRLAKERQAWADEQARYRDELRRDYDRAHQRACELEGMAAAAETTAKAAQSRALASAKVAKAAERHVQQLVDTLRAHGCTNAPECERRQPLPVNGQARPEEDS